MKVITNAINKIHDLENKVEAEISQITVDRWRNYHQELITQSAFMVGKELSITIDTAQSVADSVLHILDLLLPYPNIWQALNAADRRKAGRRYLTVIDRVSVLMNAHLSTNIRQSYSYRGNLIILKTIEFDYSHDLYISLNEANINLPIAGLNRPANGGISSMTAAKLLKLRQYMTPADANVYSAVITVKMGTTVSEGSYLQLKHPHKLSITTYRDDYYHKKHCVSWKPNSSRSGWSSSGCTISYPFVYQIACECDHLSTGFGVLDESVPIDEGDSDGGDGTTPSPPVTPGNPDEIADEIDQVLGNITDVGVNSTAEQWKESVEKLTDLVSSVTASDAAIDNGVWQNLSTSERRGSSSKIFKSVSNLSVLMNAKQSDGNQTVLSFSSIEMRSKMFDSFVIALNAPSGTSKTNHWSTDGCQLVRRLSNRSSTVCECDHLTDFAAIADISNREEPSVAKSVLTYNRTNYTLHDDQFKVKTNRFWLNLSVTVWLLISHLLIMIGMDRTEVLAVCEFSSLILLYSLLTAFSFSLMLSIHLYLSTSRRHLFRYFPFRNFALFAYLFPLLLIFLSMFFILVTEARGNFGVMLKSLTGEYL
ncbi:G-protein coupled receptor 2 [Tyrophagus putrescentiae]|nr:G-protein coupled receptor 2 [Tyrophagus putrescentiae]